MKPLKGSVPTLEVLKQHFKCSNVKYSGINPVDVLRNLSNI